MTRTTTASPTPAASPDAAPPRFQTPGNTPNAASTTSTASIPNEAQPVAPLAAQGDAGDLVVLLDDDGRAIGTSPRATVHTTNTPLHQAFSSYLFDARGHLLLTRRALTKTAWPGVWTNTCCGHPRPGEAIEDAARRRIEEELGIVVSTLTVALPRYRYRAVDASGVVEHEMCPVFVGQIDADQLDRLAPVPEEVAQTAWITWADAVTLARSTPALISPWAAEQILLLDATPQIEEIA